MRRKLINEQARRTPPPGSTSIEVCNAQRMIRVHREQLRSFAEVVLALAWPERRGHNPIPRAVLIAIVNDKRMTQLHKKFCGIATPTDVLTFQHGEIVISAQTAARQARDCGTTCEGEMRLYILHGLLHLLGYDDQNSRARAAMHRLQAKIFENALRLERMRSFERAPSHGNLANAPAGMRSPDQE